MSSARLDQWRRVWQTDRNLRRSGLGRGQYVVWFYRTRLANRFPSLFPPRFADFAFNDGIGGERFVRAKVRIDGGGGDLAIVAGLVGDREYWEPALFPARRVLDLGANVGLATLWFSLVSPGVEFACVEPDPRNLPLLQENLALNGLDGAIFSCAVDASPGVAQFGLGPHTGCSSLTSSGLHLHSHATTISVQVRTMLDILDELGWDWVDVVKMDIEGAERDILGSCSAWIERVGRVVLEIHPTTSAQEIGAMVRPFGFLVRRIGYGIEPTYVLERET